MDNKYQPNDEPLWAIPAEVGDRLSKQQQRNEEFENFKLSAIYTGVATFFLLLFGITALTENNLFHAVVLFAFSAIAAVTLVTLWLANFYWLGKHFTTGMMWLLCLYLFYTGGVQNTGPLYYAVFPSVALFLQGRLRGFLWVISLLLATVVISRGAFGFDVDRYTATFIARVVSITLIVATLTCIPEYFRLKLQRDLMLSLSDLESMSYGDGLTGLANRGFLEKMLHVEFNRHKRYGARSCLMLVEIESASRSKHGSEAEGYNELLIKLMAEILRTHLRVQDIAGRWEPRCFLLLLPEVSAEGAEHLARRLQAEFKHAGVKARLPFPAAVSIGVTEMGGVSESVVLERAVYGVHEARRQGSACNVVLA